ncbi:MAG: N4-gp56 family major capsid protein [Candidatus Paceibacterota bacterium]|jgi:N4-gp56 family major capsid protein
MSDLTTISKMVDPEVLADMIQAKLQKKIKALPYAKLDTTLQGRAGDEVTIPRFTWDGEAQVVAEGADIPLRALGTSTAKYKIQKVGIGGEITDEAILSGYGNPVGALGNGITTSILTKCDDDTHVQLRSASTIYDPSGAISYDNIVNAIDLFEEEENSEKVIFVHPLQLGTIRKDDDFIDKTKYGGNVMVTGEIGVIANARVVPSKKVAMIGGCFYNPIVKLSNDAETEDDLPAVTYYLKRNTNVETDRKSRARKTEITGDQMYVISLTNDSKVVLLKTTGAPLRAKTMYDETYTYPGTAFVFDTTGVNVATTHTGANAETLTATGTAPVIPTAAIAGLGFNESTTNAFVALLPIPGAPLTGFDATEVYYNDVAVTADDVVVIDDEPYMIHVKGVWDNAGTITSASTTLTIKYGAAGTNTTFTWDYSALTMGV